MKLLKKVNIRQILLILILLLATFLRFWNLSDVPPSASLDEASIGYNAYSVLKTGVDEYGDFPIISQRGYDDWRRSTYLFLTIPFIKLFGLNVVSVRLPAVILSVLSVWATYHIILLLFSKQTKFSANAALIGALMLAISPWHIYISRLGHESNACLAFLIFGVLFFLQGLKNNNANKIFLSLLLFVLSMISYYSGQVFIPLFILGLIFIFIKNLLSIILSSKKNLILLSALIVLSVVILAAVFSPEALMRYRGTSTFDPEAHPKEFAKRVELRNQAIKDNNLIGILLYNRRIFYVQVFIEGYVSHFNPKWLFTNFSSAHKVPNTGLLYLWEIPFILLGIFVLILSKIIDVRIKKTIFLWFLLAPLPAAIAAQVPHAMRSYNFLPIWQIFTAFGITYLLYVLRKYNKIFLYLLTLLIIITLAAFYKNYFFIFSKTQSSSFQYSLSKVIPFVAKNQTKYKKVIISNHDNLLQSYMFYLFYTRYDPKIYLEKGGTISGGYAQTHELDNLFFMPFDPRGIKDQKNILYVGNPDDFLIKTFVREKLVRIVKLHTSAVFKDLDGKTSVEIISKK